MKHYCPDQAAAQAAADTAHQHLIDTDSGYAQSVEDGKTVCWCVPAEDDQGWFIWIEPRLYSLFGIVVAEEIE